MILFFDTETTGKYDFKAESNAPHQPHLVQIAAVLATREQRVVGELNVIVRPEGWVISEEVASIHRIDQNLALQCGVPRRTALAMFSSFCKLATHTVAYNMEFDSNVLWTQFMRERVEPRSFNETQMMCAMQAATPLCKLPKAGRTYGPDPYKWPKLAQAHQHFLGTGFDEAHNAMADVHALMRVTFKMLEIGGIAL